MTGHRFREVINIVKRLIPLLPARLDMDPRPWSLHPSHFIRLIYCRTSRLPMQLTGAVVAVAAMAMTTEEEAAVPNNPD